MRSAHEFDAIVVGSGPGGASVARSLSRKGQRVLILERGGDAPLRESFSGTASILRSVPVGEKLATARAFTTGGTTAVYFAVADAPPLEMFLALGIDLSRELDEARQELPLAVLPDELLGAQALRVRESALALGHPWQKSTMLVDVAKCNRGYVYESKWNARSYLQDAVNAGATLISRARAHKVIVEDNRAVGVEYKLQTGRKRFEDHKAFAAKIILAGGSASSPILLRDCGLKEIADAGFYCHPGFAVFGTVSSLNAGENFVGSMGAHLEDGLALGDANFARTFYRMFMLSHRRLIRYFRHSKSIGVGVMVKEDVGGSLSDANRFSKKLESDVYEKLERGGRMAEQIIRHAGGRHLYRSPLSAAHLGGTVRLGEHVDERLQTQIENLHVCDASLIPPSMKIAPTLTLLCLGKYLANLLSL